MPWGFAYAPRGPVAGFVGRGGARGVHGGRSRRLAGDRRSGQPRADRPGDRGRWTARPGRRVATRPHDGRLAPGGAHPAECHPDHRPARRRGRAVGRPAQEMAPVRQQGADRRDRGRRCGRGAPRRVLSDLPRDRRPGRLPHPRRVRLPRRVEGVRADGQRPAPVRPDRGRRSAGHALPRPLRATGGGAVRRDDRRRRRVAGELPAQVGSHPLVARRRRHELRPVGSRDRRDRPLQDRLRWSRGPLHRRLGSRPEPGRTTGLRAGPAHRVGWARRRGGITDGGSAAAYGGAD